MIEKYLENSESRRELAEILLLPLNHYLDSMDELYELAFGKKIIKIKEKK
jgi:hypothetical protein